jgi:transketolase
VLWEPDSPARLVIIASGSETHLGLAAARRLSADGTPTRLVSLPCWELFGQQDPAYRDSVVPPGIPALAVEAASPLGWHRWVGRAGDVVGMDGFGASAPAPVLLAHFGFTVKNVVARARRLLDRSSRTRSEQ